MIFKKLLSAAVLASALTSGATFAAPFTINANSLQTFNPGTDGITALIDQMILNWDATSTFTDDNGIAGLDAGNGVNIAGDSVLDSGFGRIASLDLLSGNPFNVEDSEGYGSLWGLGFQYTNLMGTIAFIDGGNILANYTSGTISIFAFDTVTNLPALELMELTVVGSSGGVGLLELFTKVSDVNEDIFFMDGITDFSDFPTMTISALIDFNLKALAPTQVGNTNVYTRTSELDGSARFDVNEIPEPGVVALLGLGLIGLGAVRRSRKAA